jgi:hypothetical protein
MIQCLKNAHVIFCLLIMLISYAKAGENPLEWADLVPIIHRFAGTNDFRTCQHIIFVNKLWSKIDPAFFADEKDKAGAKATARDIKLIDYSSGRKGLSLFGLGEKITDRVFQALCDLHPTIERIDLSTCSLLTTLEPLKALIKLRSLRIQQCIGLKDISPLASLKNLYELYTEGAVYITQEQKDALKKALPTLKIKG